MSHRIREAMRDDVTGPLGGLGKIVEVDETYVGREPGSDIGPAFHHKMKVVSLVERGSGRARSFVVDGVNRSEMEPIIFQNIYQETRLMTDEHPVYRWIGSQYYDHQTVTHSAGEYVRGTAHSNTIEGFFSIFKRGMKGVYQFCGKNHLHRYLAEFDFRYTNRVALGYNDTDRADILLRGVVGKRLTYETANRASA
jgi:hypothetical protein